MMIRYVSIILVCLVSGCADMSVFNHEKKEIQSKKEQMEDGFSPFFISDSNYLSFKDNSKKPERYWSLKIKTAYFTPVSVDEVLSELAKKMDISYFDKGTDINKKTINFDGSVEEYINYLSNAYDVFIDIDKNKIVKRTIKTKIFKLYNSRYLKNKSEYSFGTPIVDSEGASGFSGSIEIGGTIDLWEEMESYLDSLKEESDSFNYAIFEEFSQVSVTGTKEQLDQVGSFVETYNIAAATQIKVSYKIITIDQKSLEVMGADLQVGNSTVKITGSSQKGFSGEDVSSVLLGAAVDGDGIGGSLTAELLKSGAKIVNGGVAISLNGKPIPVNAVNEVGYVSSVTREPGTDSSAAAETIETDTLEYGMSFMIVPEMLSNGNINITMGYSRKRLNGLDSFGESEDSVQLPNISKNENINNLIVEEGKETIAAIFTENETTKADYAALFGKSMSDSSSKSVVAMIIKVDTKK